VAFESTFTLKATLELPDICVWLLEGDFVVFVDGFMEIRVWNWKLGLWGYIVDQMNRAIDDPGSDLSNVMMSGTHIVLFNQTTAGMTYRLYALPKFYAHRGEAEVRGGENTLLQAVLFAPGGLDVDFPLTWRPATMYNPTDDNYVAISNTPFIVVTYESSTRLFVLPEFVPAHKYERFDCDDGEGGTLLPPPEETLFPEPPIDLPYMHKRHYDDHVRITSGFDAAFMVWLNDEDDWMIMPTRYDKHHSGVDHQRDKFRDHDGYRNASKGDRQRKRRNNNPRRIGKVANSHPRLLLNPMTGTAFYTTDQDCKFGFVHMWEWMEIGGIS